MSLYGGFIVKVVFVNRQHVKVRGILLVDVGKKKKKKIYQQRRCLRKDPPPPQR